MSGSGAFVGRSVLLYWSDDPSTTVVPDDADFMRLGGIRGKEYGPEWETADATSDTSPDFTRENLVTFKNNNISLNGVIRQESSSNQLELQDFIDSPPDANNNQPCGWLRIVEPIEGDNEFRQTSVPVIFTSWRKSAPHDDVATWTLEALSNGATQKVNITT